MDTPYVSLIDLPHIDSSSLGGRTVYLVPLWNDGEWRSWFPVEGGKLLKISVVDLERSQYLAEKAVRKDDVYIPFLEFIWQHMSWPKVAREVTGLMQDIHLMATSAAKLEHYHAARDMIGRELVTTFVNSEIEHLLVVARSTFDLLQAALARLWIDHIRFYDPVLEKYRKQRPMQETFSKIVLDGQKLRTAEQIGEKYNVPDSMAKMYAKHAPFFLSVRTARDHVVHFGKSPDSIYATERGFCVDPKAAYFRDFDWQQEHRYNENIVTLVPWVARLVAQTLEACSDIILSLNDQIAFPPPIAPKHHLFVRDPANSALLRLIEASQGPNHWWQEAPITAGDISPSQSDGGW